MTNKFERIYDGVAFCQDGGCCPVVDHYSHDGQVILHDPAKPENGSFTMTVEEYNAFLQNTSVVKE